MRTKESRNTFYEFVTLTDRSKDVADRLEKLEEILKGKIDINVFEEMTGIWETAYDLCLDMMMMQQDLIDNLK